MYKELIRKIKSKKIKVAIIGLGYVGLPLAVRFLKKNIHVIGIDSDIKKIQKLKKGKSYIKSISNQTISYFKKFKFELSEKYSSIKFADVIIVCLPTPLKKDSKNPDLKYLFDCAKNIKKYIKEYHIVILESTVYPGLTQIFIDKIVSNKKLISGKNFFYGYSPERENPGDKNFNYFTTPKIISGFSDKCKILVNNIYKHICRKTVLTSTIKIAETTKLLENLYRSVNIALVNEMKIISKKFNMNIFEIIDAAATKNFGFQKFTPGPGYGGHCIPIDPYYLSWASKQVGYNPRFVELAGQINTSIPSWTVREILRNKQLKNKKNINALILGVAYKKNIDDDRESPSYRFMKIFNKKKIKFDYNDPYLKSLRIGRNNSIKKKSVQVSSKNLKKYDFVILLTDHDIYNYRLIAKNAKLIFDTRGVYNNISLKDKNNIYLL